MDTKTEGKVIIIGSGNWGTTLALLFAARRKLYLWTIDQEEADAINLKHESQFLPGIKLSENIVVEKKFSRTIEPHDIVITAIPSSSIDDLMDEFIEQNVMQCIVLNASKGVEYSSLRTVGQIISDKLPRIKYANLSGPTIARELAQGIPAKAVLASRDIAVLFQLQGALENDLLKFEFSRDVQGVELAAAMKGLIAIAVGIADGLGFKTNIFGLIMTYGVREFVTVMKFLGVYHKTAYSIAGMGDLITTCISENSRNRKFGRLLAQGYKRDEALQEVGMVVEGVSMAKTITKLAKFNLSIPLITCVTHIIFEEVTDIRKELVDTLNSITD
ncbi:MAG TPA: NAD(P)H-dependent glycerol-3-phosphate dehydrogenase [Candidatus Cloacimonadota bacterium]|nr:NAD(P)H-dependent glycerol-3-phosphate dehydrogenase [Candidatus Cloacimonadota bacterium]